MDNYLLQNKLIGLKNNKETAILVANQVRSDFNTKEKKFVNLDMTKRPFLRHDVTFLLKYKEGLCGEGARVIVMLLNRLGFNACRVTLYNRHLQSSHTLASVVIDKKEYFIDSINSSKDINKFLSKNNVSSSDFNLMHYSDNALKRRSFVREQKFLTNDKYKDFFINYYIYSYESIPYSKLLTRVGIDVRVFNLQRPHRAIAILGESPNIIKAILSFFPMILVAVCFVLKKVSPSPKNNLVT